jgi:hypothetical protein
MGADSDSRRILEDLIHTINSRLVVSIRIIDRLLDPLSNVNELGVAEGHRDLELTRVRRLLWQTSMATSTAQLLSLHGPFDQLRLPDSRLDVSTAVNILRETQYWTNWAEGRRVVLNSADSKTRPAGESVAIGLREWQLVCHCILDNMASFSAPDTTGNVTYGIKRMSDRQTGSFQVVFESTGLPIYPDELGLVFQNGYRGRAARTTHATGSGAGLWMVDEMLRSVGGSISVDQAEEHSFTRISLSLPIAGTAKT